MYIWIGINVENELSELKEKAQKIDNAYKFKNSCFTLPLHISLKMSFEAETNSAPQIIAFLESYLKALQPFEVCVSGFECFDNICWIRMCKSEQLNKIHDELNAALLKNFLVPLHEYDGDYKFHTTLFMDDDKEKVKAAYDEIKTRPLVSKIRADRFVIGTSKTGALGTFSVIKEFVK